MFQLLSAATKYDTFSGAVICEIVTAAAAAAAVLNDSSRLI